MSTLVVAATRQEIGPFLEQHPEAAVLISGVGAPATMFRLTEALSRQAFGRVIQAGIAGVCDGRIGLGEVAVIARDTFGDLGILQQGTFQTLAEAGLQPPGEWPFNDGWLVNKKADQGLPGLPRVDGITVNTVTDDPARIQVLRSKFGATLESMEGAALHYVCLQRGVDFLQLRSVSNVVGERDKTKWRLRESIQRLNEVLATLVQSYT